MSKQYIPPEDILAQQEQKALATPARLARIRRTARNRQAGIMVVMEDVHNPHNLAAVARSCDAFGVQELGFTLDQGEDELFDLSLIGKVSSSSASKWLNYRIFQQGTRHALTMLKQEGWTILATVLSERARPIYDLNFASPEFERVVVLVGNEQDGLSQTAQTLADVHMVIPMLGMIESFNVSVATAITLFEITRQRRASGRDYRLDEAQSEALVADLLRRKDKR